MGRNSIERGQRDYWTPRPGRIAAVERAAAADRAKPGSPERNDAAESGAASAPAQLPLKYYPMLHRPDWRDPRAFIIPSDQPDFPTAIKFINALVKTGIAIHRAPSDFIVAGKKYPAGSYVVKTDQAFRPHVLDMFEPQDHPNDFQYPGGPPVKPYDVAGWTLAFEMGVQFDRVLEPLTAPLDRVPYGELQRAPSNDVTANAAGFAVGHEVNDAFVLANRLLKSGMEVYWLKDGLSDNPAPGRGTWYVPNLGVAREVVQRTAREFGFKVSMVAQPPGGAAIKLAPVRVALWDRYGGSIPSGWTRWLLEQFEFPFEVVYSPQIDAGNLRARYDAIIFVSGAMPAPQQTTTMIAPPRDLPAEYRLRTGRLTTERSIAPLREFLERGGTVIALGSSTALAYQLALPIHNALLESSGPGGQARALPDEKFYVPGSILQAKVDRTDPLAWGMPERADFYFDRSPALKLAPDAAARGVRAIAWFERASPLRSGWAWGQSYLEGTVTAATVAVGAGQLDLFATEIAFRGQTHGTFKLLFNALDLATAKTVSQMP